MKILDMFIFICLVGILGSVLSQKNYSYEIVDIINDTIYIYDTLYIYAESEDQHPVEIPDVEDDIVKNYLRRFTRLALDESEKYGILPSIKLGQAILESSSGTSELAIKGKNHFGIKHKIWNNEMDSEITGIIYAKDDCPEYCKFSSFKSDWASFRAHSLILCQDRYSKVLDARNYTEAAQQLSKAGYATDIHYWRKLVRVIEKYKLFVLDNNINKSR